MSTITLRNTKGSALTFTEMDDNFSNLNSDKLENITTESIGDLSDVDLTGNANEYILVYNSTSGNFEVEAKPATGISNVVEDTTPQLGGNLDAQSFNITSLGTLNTHTVPGGTGTLALTSDITFTSVVDDTTPQLGGDLDCQGNLVQNPVLEDYAETINSLGTTDTPTLTVSNGNVQSVSITSGLTLNQFSDAASGQSMTLIVSGSGSITAGTGTWKFAGGNKTLTTESIISIFYDGTTYYASVATDFQA